MQQLTIAIKNLTDLPLPTYQSDGAAGMDLLAAIETPIVLEPNQIRAIPTGIQAAIPIGYELQIRGRSGLALKHGISLANGIGTIDSDYRGEIHAILVNRGHEPFTINRGDRIAQAVVARYEHVTWNAVENLDDTPRGSSGFGSTGVQ